MKTTILGGILFLAPFAVLVIIVGKVFQISMLVVQPLERYMPIQDFAGVASINILAIGLILFVCYVAGLAAKRAFFGQRMQRLDGALIDLIPGYAVFKSLVSSVSPDDTLTSMLRPVLVRFDDYDQIAFLTEEGDRQSVVFLPGAPSAWSGSTVVVDTARITPLNIPAYQATKLLRTFGRGSIGVTAPAAQAVQK